MDLVEGSEQRGGLLVSEGHVDHAVVGNGGESVDGGGLLASSGGTGGHKDTGVLAGQSSAGKETSSLVPERSPLGRLVTESSGDTHKDTIVLGDLLGGDDGVIGLGGALMMSRTFWGRVSWTW